MKSHAEELREAARRWAAEALEREDGHPSLAALAAHAAGTAGTADAAGEAAGAERLRSHLAVCPECAALVLDLAAFPDVAPAAGVPPLSAAELAADWERLAPQVPAAPRAAGPRRQAGGRRAPAGRVAWALAASFAGLFVVAGLWGLQQRRASRDLAAPQLTNLSEVDLAPADATLRGGGDAAGGAAAAGRALVLRLNAGRLLGEGPFELLSARDGGAARELARGLEQDEDGVFSLALPAGTLRPGSYELRLRREDDPERRILARFELTIVRE